MIDIIINDITYKTIFVKYQNRETENKFIQIIPVIIPADLNVHVQIEL
jgi:hypothetical protein